MIRLFGSLLVLVCIAGLASPQAPRRRHQIAKLTKRTMSARASKRPTVSRSIVGLEFRFVTPDHNGGVWITGSAWLFRGLMVNDRSGRTKPITIPGPDRHPNCDASNSSFRMTDMGGAVWGGTDEAEAAELDPTGANTGSHAPFVNDPPPEEARCWSIWAFSDQLPDLRCGSSAKWSRKRVWYNYNGSGNVYR